jgi:hypothetical protein
MSASEKLRALDAGFDRVTPIMRKTGPKVLGADAYTHAKDIHAYVDALPQIIAVVEAAELGRHYTKAMHSWYWDKGDVVTADTIHESLGRIDEALVALEKALP